MTWISTIKFVILFLPNVWHWIFGFFFYVGKEFESLKYEKISIRCFNLEELERATKNFSQDCLLGSGAFGNVYKGTFELEGILAIKRSHSESFLSVEEFRNG